MAPTDDEALTRRLEAIERRVQALEQAAASPARLDTSGPDDDAARWWPSRPEPADGADVASRFAAGVGKALLVIGGAYLLRAGTDAGVVPVAAGVAAGLVYSLVWSVAGGFLSAAGMIVGYSLTSEVALRFAIIDAEGAAVLLASLAMVHLGYAWTRRQHTLAWVAVSLATIAGLVLMVRLSAPLPFAIVFIGLGVATLWLGYTREWVLLRWPTATVANLVAAGLTVRAAGASPLDAPAAVVAVQTLLWTVYLASFAVRTLALRRRVVPFELVQTPFALAAGLGGAWFVAPASATTAALLGALTLLLAAVAYVVAFVFTAHREGAAANFHFYATLALVLAMAGSGLLLGPTERGLTWAGAGVATAWAAARFHQPQLAAHAAFYFAASALATGLLRAATATLMTATAFLAPRSEIVVLLAASAACVLLGGEAARAAVLTAARGALAALTVWCAAGVAVGAGAALMPGAHMVFAVRTVTLATCATGCALAARSRHIRAFAWLMYPVLGLAGLSAIADLRTGHPATLVVSLATYGVALLVAPRLRRAPLLH